MPVYNAVEEYKKRGTDLVVIGGKEYGTGSSRDWAAKGTKLLGVKVVIAESFERIHRSNLIGMGVLPLQFTEGNDRLNLKLTGSELITVLQIEEGINTSDHVQVEIKYSSGDIKKIKTLCRIDTKNELEYYKNGGILQYVTKEYDLIMDEEVTIIDSNTRNEKIKNFFINNKKNLIVGVSIILFIIIGYLVMIEMKEQNKIKLANQFNIIKINFKTDNKQTTIDQLTKLIKENDATYSPLALYFLIDNNLITNQKEINNFFDELINKTSLDDEIKNLIIYKKALFNSDFANENDLLQILNPIINSESIWKSHSLYLAAEYFYSKNQKKKSQEFFNQILLLPNANMEIKAETQKKIK